MAERASEELLARTRAALAPWAGAVLERLGADCDAKLAGTRDELVAILAKHGYEPADAVLHFDASFGGLLVPNRTAERWREENLWGLCGAYGCLKLGGDRVRASIFHHAKVYLWGLDFWSLCLDDVTVPKLVVIGATTQQAGERVIAMLRDAAPELCALALATTSDQPALQAKIAAFQVRLRAQHA